MSRPRCQGVILPAFLSHEGTCQYPRATLLTTWKCSSSCKWIYNYSYRLVIGVVFQLKGVYNHSCSRNLWFVMSQCPLVTSAPSTELKSTPGVKLPLTAVGMSRRSLCRDGAGLKSLGLPGYWPLDVHENLGYIYIDNMYVHIQKHIYIYHRISYIGDMTIWLTLAIWLYDLQNQWSCFDVFVLNVLQLSNLGWWCIDGNGKSPGFNRKINCKWWISNCHVWSTGGYPLWIPMDPYGSLTFFFKLRHEASVMKLDTSWGHLHWFTLQDDWLCYSCTQVTKRPSAAWTLTCCLLVFLKDIPSGNLT